MDLKTELCLQNLPKVYYARLIGVGYKIYFVFFDSRRPHVNLTSVECHRHTFAPVVNFKNGERYKLTNILPIEQFKGNKDNALFIRVDLSGRLQQMQQFTEKTSTLLVEDMNLKDFKSVAAVSAMVQRQRKIRRQLLGGSEIKYVKLADLVVNKALDAIEFSFLSTVTPDGKPKYKTDPTNGFHLVANPTGTYLVQLRMEKFFTWLFDTMPDGVAFTYKDLKEAMEVCPIKMWDNDPSLYWQGFGYNLSQLDASIYKVDIPPKQWNKIHGGDFFLSKHMTALIMNIDFFLNNMTSMLIKRLKTMGILDTNYSFKRN